MMKIPQMKYNGIAHIWIRGDGATTAWTRAEINALPRFRGLWAN